MYYFDVAKNIASLIKTVGEMTREQVVTFFSDIADEEKIKYDLDMLTQEGFLSYVNQYDSYYFVTSTKLRSEPRRKLMAALQVFTNVLHSEDVRFVLMMNYITPIVAYAADDSIYEFTVCDSVSDARMAKRVRDAYAVQGDDDVVNRIAIVTKKSLVDSIKPFGFDNICVLEEGIPQFVDMSKD